MLSNKETAVQAIMDNHIVLYEFLRCMTGDLLGEGAFRYVFDNPFNTKQVIKIDMSETNSNVVEFDLWQSIMGNENLKKYFAPVIHMSPCGRIMLMQKADMDRPIEDYPNELPEFFTDIKKSNFGFIKDVCVCVDYGYNDLYLHGQSFKMKNITW